MNILVIGASRGIGLEFVQQYRAAGDRVIATARDDAGLERLRALNAVALKLDVASPASVSGLAWQLDGEKIDVALYVAGVLTRADARTPPTQPDFDHVMHTNVLGAMQTIPQVAPLVEAAQGRFGFISSDMGHIAGVGSSYSWTYRVSKAALNMAVASAKHDYPDAIFAALSPGWVQTDMGGSGASLTAHDSVAAMRRTLAQLKPSDSGGFFGIDGKPMAGW
jgi:NAD(P)-dependent dehydrogenase (short-subunit alcohol dehydrogenase family)